MSIMAVDIVDASVFNRSTQFENAAQSDCFCEYNTYLSLWLTLNVTFDRHERLIVA